MREASLIKGAMLLPEEQREIQIDVGATMMFCTLSIVELLKSIKKINSILNLDVTSLLVTAWCLWLDWPSS